jgi:small subunit ribosomal protein S18
MTKPARSKNRDNARRSKRKVSVLTEQRLEYVDWKDVSVLRRFMSDRAKIRARRVTGNDAQQQREIARAIKNAREMALLPYATRITQQRGGRRGDGERGSRAPREPGAEQDPTQDPTQDEVAFEEGDLDELPEGIEAEADIEEAT